MDLGLKGKIALVAASSRGLGRAVAEELETGSFPAIDPDTGEFEAVREP